MPMLSESGRRAAHAVLAACRRPTRCSASAREVSTRIAANSSPPMRATTSVERTVPLRMVAAAISAASPAAWPSRR